MNRSKKPTKVKTTLKKIFTPRALASVGKDPGAGISNQNRRTRK